jgi:hypothetical protein
VAEKRRQEPFLARPPGAARPARACASQYLRAAELHLDERDDAHQNVLKGAARGNVFDEHREDGVELDLFRLVHQRGGPADAARDGVQALLAYPPVSGALTDDQNK